MAKDQNYVHLDFVRGVAAFLVLLTHVRVVLFPMFDSFPPELKNPITRSYIFVSGFGQSAVLIFFTLSGFLIIKTVVKSLRTWRWRGYLLDRLVRLWTVLIPSLVVTSVLVLIGRGVWNDYAGGAGHMINPDQVDISLTTFLGNVAFLQELLFQWFGDNNALWSLSYEFWYYILFPVIALLFVRNGGSRVCYCFLLGVTVACLLTVNSKVLLLFPCWLIGGGAVLLGKREILMAQQTKGAIMVAAYLQLIGILIAHRVLRSESHWMDYFLSASTTLFIAASVSTQHPGFGNAFGQVARFIAKMSYSLYLFHYSFLGLLFYCIFNGKKIMPTTHNLLWAVVFVIFTWLYTLCCYFVFERQTYKVRSMARQIFE